MMPEKRKFGQLLRKEIKSSHPLFEKEVVSGEECKNFVRDIENLWDELGKLTEHFQLEVLHGKNICFIRTISKEEKKEFELARVPVETGREGKGTDLVQLTWLLIIESWDQLFSRRLEREKGEVHLDSLIQFQEEEYGKIIKELEGKKSE